VLRDLELHSLLLVGLALIKTKLSLASKIGALCAATPDQWCHHGSTTRIYIMRDAARFDLGVSSRDALPGAVDLAESIS